MKIKKIEMNNFKRFTHLSVEGIPEATKLVVLVGPNGSGKTSIMEAMNHYYKCAGYNDAGDYHYLSKAGNVEEFDLAEWRRRALNLVNIDFHEAIFPNELGYNDDIRRHFYFRSAYRNEPDFQINVMQKQQDPTESIRLSSLIQNDRTVSANYQRLIANTIAGVFDNANDAKTVATLRDELIGKIQVALKHVFEDLELSSVGDPLQNGNFYFTKGTTKNFSYRNLSAGEKAAFDLILDMVVQSQYYPDAIYCIDEPETHMHTKLQGRVLRELYLLIPGQSQLWLSTHSIGMLQEAEEIEKEHPGTVAFLDFGGRDFDTDQLIRPGKAHGAVSRHRPEQIDRKQNVSQHPVLPLQHLFLRGKVQRDGLDLCAHLDIPDTGGIHHPLGRHGRQSVRVFVREVVDLLYAALDDGLGTFVAGEERDIDLASAQVAAGVQYRIELCVADIGVFCIKRISLALPRELVIVAAGGEAVIADGHYPVSVVYDAGAHLGVRILAPASREHRDPHKILVPRDIIASFRHFSPLRFPYNSIIYQPDINISKPLRQEEIFEVTFYGSFKENFRRLLFERNQAHHADKGQGARA